MWQTARIRVIGLFLAAAVPACHSDPRETATAANDRTPVPICGNDGYLAGELYGEIRATLNWDNRELECEGMPRPDGVGARLRFAGLVEPGGRQIAIIIAMPEFTLTTIADELAANVTLIEEGNGRFFSTPDLDNCLGEIGSIDAIDDSGDRYAVTGALYCVSPLPEVNGDSSVSIPELTFSGLLDWGAS